MSPETKAPELLAPAAQALRQLAVDAILAAGSGHVGLPLGCAELGALIYGRILRYDPNAPHWLNRDRFVLSAGHGSILMYSLLHMCGYHLSIDDLRNFRQLDSRTPGHPEHGLTPGVETTTGPLGQGFANAVGMAVSERMLAARFNRDAFPLVDHRIYVLAGEGDLMEGVSYEAASLAGHLRLSRLTVFVDSNSVTIDGETDLAFSEDLAGRFHAAGWQVLHADGYDPDSVLDAVAETVEDERPSLILVSTVIGRGLPRVEGTSAAHGGALSDEDARTIRQGSDSPPFEVPDSAYRYFEENARQGREQRLAWETLRDRYQDQHPQVSCDFARLTGQSSGTSAGSGDAATGEAGIRGISREVLPQFAVGDRVATRIAGGQILSALRRADKSLVGGSADLTVPCFGPELAPEGFTRENRKGWFVSFGVREHAMGSVCNGIALHGGLRPFCGTFLAFSDYMRPSIRMAALMRTPVVFVFTHDSIRIGQDGPTHQPVEHMATLRALPGLVVLRPADALETTEAWLMAYDNTSSPTAILLARQPELVFDRSVDSWRRDFRRGAYVVRPGGRRPGAVVVATGSEVQVALEALDGLGETSVRLVSMPEREIFRTQPAAWRDDIVPRAIPTLVVEAGCSQGWGDVFSDARVLSIDSFGLSAPGDKAAERLGLGTDDVAKEIHALLQ